MGSSTEEADGTINICAHGRESATLLCYGCYKAPDAEGGHVETVWYCSANCQKADWKFHKHDCRRAQARRSLYRVGETANLAFFRFVERTFDLHIVGVEDRGNVLYIHQGPQDRSTFNQFPSEHLKSDQDKQAAMARMKCRASEEYVQILVEDMLQGQDFLNLLTAQDTRAATKYWGKTIKLTSRRHAIRNRRGPNYQSQIPTSVSTFPSNPFLESSNISPLRSCHKSYVLFSLHKGTV